MGGKKEKRETPNTTTLTKPISQCIDADQPYWYMNRLQNTSGFIIQVKIDEPGFTPVHRHVFTPVHRIRQRKTSTIIEIRTAKKKRLHIETEKYIPEKKSTFSHYDTELGIYTLQVKWRPETTKPE